MRCPLCGDQCRCAEPSAFFSSALVDPDAPDDSEEQFAASLASPAKEPERGDNPAEAPPAPYKRIIMPEPEPMEEQFVTAVSEQLALAPEPQFHDQPGDIWRQEVASRVENYRAKRRRRGMPTRQPSLRLDFEALQQLESQQTSQLPESQPASTTVRWDGMVSSTVAQQGPEPEPSNIIEFPGPSAAPPVTYQLAEPVQETPRILDAPEFVQHALPTPMAAISLENEQDTAPAQIEIPLQVAPLPIRMFGGLVDFAIVLAACGVFGVIVARICESIEFSKPMLALGLAVPCFFWLAYQYLFLVHTGRTPGMRLAGVSLVDFDGKPVRRSLRRWRALAMVLSCVSIAMGFIWALVDEDTLTWHDRITRTYMVEAARNQ